MFQRVTIIGNLGGDPDLRVTPQTGTPVCSFNVATNEQWTDQGGQRQERTTWWRVSAWGKLGEICHQYLGKGRRVFVEGTMAVDQETGGPRIWTDQNGNPRASLELRATNVKFLDGRGAGSDDQGYDDVFAAPAAPAPAPMRQQAAPAPQPAARQQPAASPARQPAPAAAAAPNAGRRSTGNAGRQAPPAPMDDDFGPDEIPF